MQDGQGNRNTPDYGRNLRIAYLVALASIGLLSVFSHFRISAIELALVGDGTVINVAGRQPQFSQTISGNSRRLLDELGRGNAEGVTLVAGRLREGLNLWQARHRNLLEGNEELGLSGDNSPAIENALLEVGEIMAGISASTNRLLGLSTQFPEIYDTASLQTIVSSINRDSDIYLDRMNTVVDMYESASAQRIERLSTAQAGGTALTVLLMFCLAAFVFEPAIRRLSRAELDLVGLRTAVDRHALYSVTDKRGRIIDVNEGFCRLSGYTREDLIGHSHKLVNSGQHRGSFWREMWTSLSAGKPWRAEVCNKASDGKLYWVDSTNIPQFDARGRIERLISLSFNITEKKRDETILAQAHRDLGNLINAARQFSVIACDVKGIISTFNAGAEQLLGYSAEEMIGKQSPSIFHIEAEIRERGEELSRQAGKAIEGAEVLVHKAREGDHEGREWTFVRKDGSTVPVHLTVTAVRDTDGKLTGFLGVARDISMRKEIERKLTEQRAVQRAIIDALPSIVFYKNDRNVILDCNQPAARFLQKEREEICGTPANELFSAEDAETYAQSDREALETGKPVLGKIASYELEGEEAVHMRLDTVPIRGPSGNFDRVVAIATDTSDVINASVQIREAEQRLELAMRASSTGLWDWDIPSGRIFFNEVVFTMLGFEHEELELNIDAWKRLCHPEDLARASQAIAEHIDGVTDGYSCEYRLRRRDGSYIWIRDVGQIVERDTNGLPKRLIGVYINNQEIRDALDKIENSNLELQHAQQRIELALEGSRDAIFDWDLNSREIYFSSKWSELLKLPSHALGNDLFDLIHHIAPGDCDRVQQELQGFLNSSNTRFESEFQLLDSEGLPVWVLMRAVSLSDEQGRIERVAGSVADISSLKAVQTEMQRLVEQDHLTGLASRSRLNDRLNLALARTRRAGTYCGILFFDFDRFKVVNDSLGHDIGDKLLCSIAQRLKSHIREADTPSRFGGDEFVILLEDLDDPSMAATVANKLLEVCAEPHNIDGHSLVSTASIGFVTSEHGDQSASALLRYADAAMYEAKRRGRCCAVEFDKQMFDAQIKKASLEEDLQHAVARDELSLHYQPIVDLETGTFVSAEALLRWKHPSLGDVPPQEFITIAEESRLIVPIGEWVIHEACKQLVAWRDSAVVAKDFAISINASKVQLLTQGFRETLIRLVDEYGLPRTSIKIEVTETTVVDNRSAVGDVLRSLREQSFVIMMDDFGTGHSSLSVLHNLPIDELKIDQSFVRNADTSRDLAAITSSIVTLAEHLNLKTIGEGIESGHHVALLQTLNCNYGQGYFWSRPVPAEGLEALFARNALAGLKQSGS